MKCNDIWVYKKMKESIISKIKINWYYIAYTVIISIIHIPMSYISDDAVKISNNINLSVVELAKMYWNNAYSGRYFIDTLGDVLFKIPINLWKAFDILVYLLIVVFLNVIFDVSDKNKPLVCGLMLLFPVSLMQSAGYISTSVNYLYPVLCILIVAWSCKNIILSGKSMLLLLLLVIPILYLTNSDQAAVMLIALCVAIIIMLLMNYKMINKSIYTRAIITMPIVLTEGVLGYLIYWIAPGHRSRATLTGGSWSYPGFENWNLFTKIYRGYSSTVANVMMQYVGVYVFLTFLLFVLCIAKEKALYKKIIISVPFFFSIFELVTKYKYFVYSGDNMYGLYDMYLVSEGKKYGLVLMGSIFIVGCLIYGVCELVDNTNLKIMTILIFLFGCGTRLIMGLSNTLFGSGTRTFTMMIFSLIVCTIILLKELDKLDIRYYSFTSGALSFAVILSFLL